jgi:hypothetical protein
MAIKADIAAKQFEELVNLANTDRKKGKTAQLMGSLITSEAGEEKAPSKKVQDQQVKEVKTCLNEVVNEFLNWDLPKIDLASIAQTKRKVELANSAQEMAEAVQHLLTISKKLK